MRCMSPPPFDLSDNRLKRGRVKTLIPRQRDRCEPGNANGACCSGRQINHAAAYKRSPVRNADHDTATGFLVGDTHSRAERKCPMRGRQSRWIHTFPTRGLSSGIAIAIAIDRSNSRLCLRTPCEGKTHCKRYCEGFRLHSTHPVLLEKGAPCRRNAASMWQVRFKVDILACARSAGTKERWRINADECPGSGRIARGRVPPVPE